MSTNKVLCARLNDGRLMPVVGYGTWQLANDLGTELSSLAAMRMGYYLIDTAQAYGNQEALGAALETFKENSERKQIKIVPDGTPFEIRDEADFIKDHQQATWVTGKVFTRNYTPEGVRSSVEDHLKKCRRDYADLYLMHWPAPMPLWSSEAAMKSPENAKTRLTVWHALEDLVAEGKIKSIGVCNFMVKHLKPLVDDVLARKAAGDKKALLPVMNQIEVSPGVQPAAELLQLCRENGIHITGYSTLGSTQGNIRNSEAIEKISEKVGHSPTQVILRWALQKGYMVIPRTRNAEHARENLEAVSFKLDDDDIKAIDNTPAFQRVCPNPYDAE